MYKNLILITVASLAIGAVIGRYSAPKNVTNKDEQTRTVNTNQNVTESSKETRYPDGTITIEKRKEKETKKITEEERKSSSTTESRPSYRVGALYEPAIKSVQEVSYQVIVEKRIFSEVYGGVSASSRRTVGLSISLGF